MSLFDKIANNLQAHPDQAQIVLGLGGNGKDIYKGLELLAAWDKHRAVQGQDARNTEAVLVINTNVAACREMVLKLTENGFNEMQAVYPQALEKRSREEQN